MARTFSGTGQYLIKAAALATAAPLTFAAWMNLNSTSVDGCFQAISSTIAAICFDSLRYSADNLARAEAVDAGVDDDTATSSTATTSTGVWYHVVSVFTSSTSRTCYVNGGGNSTSVVSATPNAADLNQSTIGNILLITSSVEELNGQVAFPACWNIALSASDVKSLSLGASPRKIHPEALVSYTRLTGGLSPEPDMVSSLGWSLVSTPTQSANPRLYAP